MPLLPPSAFDEEDNDQIFSEDFEDAFRQREPSTASQSTSADCNTADEVKASVERTQESAEDEGDESTSFDELLWDAQNYYHDSKPEFVITGNSAKLNTTKLVDMGAGQTAEMTFVAWKESKGQGYWMLEDNYGQKNIVKFFTQGHCYKAWLGTEEGFAKHAIAWPEKHRKKRRYLPVKDDVDVVEDYSDGALSNTAQTCNRELRKKTWTQTHPYAADKEVHAAMKHGKLKRTSDIDAREVKLDKPSKRKTLATPRQTPKANPKKQRQSQSSPTIIPGKTERTPDEFIAHVNAKTSLLTKLPPDDEPLPIFLTECPDVTTLWDKVVSMWASDIEGTVKSMSIRFPWLGPEYNIKLKAGMAGSYKKMIEEIYDAPCWRDGTDKCSVDIVLQAAVSRD